MVRATAIASLGAVMVLSAGMKWTATLVSQGGSSVVGTVTVEQLQPAPMAMQDSMKSTMPAMASTRATISITGSKTGASHAWHIHTGTCAAIGAIVTKSADYPNISVGSDGAGTATANLMGSVGNSPLIVAVHKGGAETETVACGSLRSSATP